MKIFTKYIGIKLLMISVFLLFCLTNLPSKLQGMEKVDITGLRNPEPSPAGLVVARFKSVQPLTTGGSIYEYEAVRIIHPLANAQGLSVGSLVDEVKPPDESELSPAMAASFISKTTYFLLRVTHTNHGLSGDVLWSFESTNIEKSADTEMAGIKLVKTLRTLPSSKAGSFFLHTAEQGQGLSLTWVLEVRNLVPRTSSDEQRLLFVQGLTTILNQKKASNYVREAALITACGISLADRKEASKPTSLIFSSVLSAFHDSVSQASPNFAFEEFALEFIAPLLPTLKSEPELQNPLRYLKEDLVHYRRQLLSMKKEVKVIGTSNMYTDVSQQIKNRNFMLIKTVLDVLK